MKKARCVAHGQANAPGPTFFTALITFSVPLNGSVHFNNANDITTIFSRVTGGNASHIQGLLRTNGTADLFLMNPAGIIFSENVALDIGGSFFATTAENLIFGEDLHFSAIHPTHDVPLPTMNVTPGLQMGRQSKAITVNGPGHLTLVVALIRLSIRGPFQGYR